MTTTETTRPDHVALLLMAYREVSTSDLRALRCAFAWDFDKATSVQTRRFCQERIRVISAVIGERGGA